MKKIRFAFEFAPNPNILSIHMDEATSVHLDFGKFLHKKSYAERTIPSEEYPLCMDHKRRFEFSLKKLSRYNCVDSTPKPHRKKISKKDIVRIE